jgi:hypothetical protein
MKRFIALALPLSAIFAAPGLAQAPDASATSAAAKKVTDPNKIVCHTEGVTGSLLASKRECHTVTQWQDMQRQQRADIQQAQSGH